jgi:mRNA interferase MazF
VDVLYRGHIWYADLDPVRGHEQAGDRPCLIVSYDPYHRDPRATLVVVLPISTTLRGAPLHIPVDPPDGGLTASSVILCDHIRSISQDRLRRMCGVLSSPKMALVEDRLRILLQL